MLPRQTHFPINSSTHFLVNPFPRQPISSSTSDNTYYQNMNIDKSCHNSSCEPTATGRRSKKRSRIYRMRTESLTTDSFFDLSFWCIGIPNGFASVTACGCLGSDCPVICRYLVYIYCPKESKCRHLQNPSKIPLSCQGTIKIKR